MTPPVAMMMQLGDSPEEVASRVLPAPEGVFCPLQGWLRGQFPGKEVKVSLRYFWVGKDKFTLPVAAREFVRDFDEGRWG